VNNQIFNKTTAVLGITNLNSGMASDALPRDSYRRS
jgi:hypothetical protein